MRVGIYETRNEHMIRPFDQHARLKGGFCFLDREYGRDSAIGYSNGMALEDIPGGLHGDAPAGYDQGVTVLHSRRSIRVAQGSASLAFQAFLSTSKTAVSGPSVVLFASS